MAKKKFPDLVYVREETPGNGLDPYLEVHHAPPASTDQWDKFAIYKRIGTGRSRLIPEVIEDGKPHKAVRVRIKQ